MVWRAIMALVVILAPCFLVFVDVVGVVGSTFCRAWRKSMQTTVFYFPLKFIDFHRRSCIDHGLFIEFHWFSFVFIDAH